MIFTLRNNLPLGKMFRNPFLAQFQTGNVHSLLWEIASMLKEHWMNELRICLF